MLSQENAQALTHQVLQRCQPQQAEVLLQAGESALTRFANNAIHQNVAENNTNLTLRLVQDGRVGIASTNRSDDAALDELVRRARQNAQASPPDPNFPGLPEPQTYTPVGSFDPSTAAYSPHQRAEQVALACRLAQEKGMKAFGAYTTSSLALAVANSLGVFAYHARTQADYQTVVSAEDSSGWAQDSAWQVGDLDVEALAREAIERAERGRQPRKIEPGEYSVVLAPYAVDDMLTSMDFYGMGAQSVQEGRSWMNDRLQQQAMSVLVSIWDDAADLKGLPQPFDFEGTPRQRVEIVQRGVVMGPVFDRYSARKQGVNATGHTPPPGLRGMGPLAMNLFMAAGDASVEQMIASTPRGLYITRFWYTRLMHPRDCLMTGMTRDGVLMIEDGEIAYSVKNLRFTQSYVQALAEVEQVGSQTRLLLNDFGAISTRVPAVKIASFHFTGSTV